MTAIFPIPKSPGIPGRFGSDLYQDWFRSLILCAELSKVVPCPRFVIVSAFRMTGHESDIEIYSRILHAHAPGVPIEVIERGVETIEQIDVIREFAQRCDEEILIVSTFLHALRVRYLARGISCTHYTAFGIPMPREVVTDAVLTVAMPILDMLGLRQWFKRRIVPRRETGSF